MTADEYDTGGVFSPNRRARPGAIVGGAIVGGGAGTEAAPVTASNEGYRADRNRGDQP